MELRVLAHLSGDEALVALLRQAGAAGDAFNLIASTWLGSGACLHACMPALAAAPLCVVCAAHACLLVLQNAPLADFANVVVAEGSCREGPEKAIRVAHPALPCPALPLPVPPQAMSGQ
jgi:hypothetical protein